MKVTTERLDNCQINLIVELDADEVDQKLRQTAKRISQKVAVPGYRRGKAPFQAVIRTFGREAIQRESLEDFGNKLYEQALKEIDYEPYAVGELQKVEWDPFRMIILLPIQPEVELGDYRAVRVPLEPEPVRDVDVEARLAQLGRQYSQWVPVDRPAAFGDEVVLDLEGKVGDRQIMSQENQEMRLEAGAKAPMPGLHEEIVGMSPGEEKVFVLTVPQGDYEADLVGREATIKARLHTVREEDIPPLDDDLALMVGDYDSLEALRAAIREEMETAARQKAEAEYLDKVLEAMVEEAVKIEYPPQAVDREVEREIERMEQNLSSSALSLDQYLAMFGKTRESYKQEIRPAVEARLRKLLVLGKIARVEGLTVSEDEVTHEIEQLIAEAGAQAARMQEMLAGDEGRRLVADNLLTDKAQELVVQIGKGEAPPLAVEAEAEAEAGVEAEAEAIEKPESSEQE